MGTSVVKAHKGWCGVREFSQQGGQEGWDMSWDPSVDRRPSLEMAEDPSGGGLGRPCRLGSISRWVGRP